MDFTRAYSVATAVTSRVHSGKCSNDSAGNVIAVWQDIASVQLSPFAIPHNTLQNEKYFLRDVTVCSDVNLSAESRQG
jgi:hypothetical protein